MKKRRLTVKYIIERHRKHTWYNLDYVACRKIKNLDIILKRLGLITEETK